MRYVIFKYKNLLLIIIIEINILKLVQWFITHACMQH